MDINSNHSFDDCDISVVRRRRRRRKRVASFWPVLSLGIILSVLVGFALRFGVLGQWVNASYGATSDEALDQNQVIDLPQSVTVQSMHLARGYALDAVDFTNGLEGSGFSVSYAFRPDFNLLGRQTVELCFTSANGTAKQTAELHIFELINEVTVISGSGQVADMRSFVPDPSVEATFIGLTPSEIPEGEIGTFELEVSCDGKEYPVHYIVGEDIPPMGVGQMISTPAGMLPLAEALVTNIQDDSEVTVTYLNKPDLTVLGHQDVSMLLTDTYGNRTEVPAVIEIVPAEDGPRFAGLEELHIQVGGTISYKSGVTATDPEDGELTFTVDPGNVDAKTIGTYTASYTAKDSDGNVITAYRTIVIQDEAEAAVEEYAKKVLEKIIKEDMTVDQKIYQVYLYTRHNVLFVGTSDKSSVVHGAYEGFSTGKGDCYTYYAMNAIMLDLLGIKNLEVARVGGTSNHWWNLVLHEDGKYYHVDSCPKSIYLDSINYYRMSDTDLDTYTYDKAVFKHRPNYYVYDKTLPDYQGIEIAP